MLGARYGVGDILYSRHMMGGEGDRHVDEVNNPPENGLTGRPGAVSGVDLLQAKDLLALLGILPVKGPENLIERM